MDYFKSKGFWLKGALHVHSNFSDAQLHIDRIIELYKKQGYDFLVITDHRKINNVYKKRKDIIIIEGMEIDDCHMIHVVTVGVKKPLVERTKTVPEMVRFAKENSGFYFLAHPYWSDLRTDFKYFKDFYALEVLNAGTEIDIGRGCSEYFWDSALSDGHKLNAVAVDDTHQRHADYCLGWVNVKVKEKNQNNIIKSLRKGHYYSSAGPKIIDISINKKPVLGKIKNALYNPSCAFPPKCTGTISVKTSPCKQIRFICNTDWGVIFTAKNKKGIQLAEFQLRGEETYVRIECIDFEGRKAWSNPIYISK